MRTIAAKGLLLASPLALTLSGCSGLESVPTHTLPPTAPEEVREIVERRHENAIHECVIAVNADLHARAVNIADATFTPSGLDGAIVRGQAVRDADNSSSWACSVELVGEASFRVLDITFD